MIFCLCSCNILLKSDFTSDTDGNISAVNQGLSSLQQVTKAILRCRRSPSAVGSLRGPLRAVRAGHNLQWPKKCPRSSVSETSCRSSCFEAPCFPCCSRSSWASDRLGERRVAPLGQEGIARCRNGTRCFV